MLMESIVAACLLLTRSFSLKDAFAPTGGLRFAVFEGVLLVDVQPFSTTSGTGEVDFSRELRVLELMR